MKYILRIFLTINFCGLAVLAQDSAALPEPPPPPLIYKTPEKELLKEFTPDDKTFKITFPGTPAVSREGDDVISVKRYRVYRQGSNSVISTYDLKSDIEASAGLFFERFRSRLASKPNLKIEAEKDVEFGGKKAKEFDVLDGIVYQKIRILAVGTRMYEIRTDVTNWHLLGDLTKKAFLAETERFFNSFKIL